MKRSSVGRNRRYAPTRSAQAHYQNRPSSSSWLARFAREASRGNGTPSPDRIRRCMFSHPHMPRSFPALQAGWVTLALIGAGPRIAAAQIALGPVKLVLGTPESTVVRALRQTYRVDS